ncbi:MAG TPA: hypothetical protein VNO70_06435, partial [Blastocatellia bacterium]|nr:hypothetical protein [Blastocatellia bacterium]
MRTRQDSRRCLAPTPVQRKVPYGHTDLLIITLLFCLASVFGSLHLVSARGTQEQSADVKAPLADDGVSVRASGRGNPWLSFADGRDLP